MLFEIYFWCSALLVTFAEAMVDLCNHFVLLYGNCIKVALKREYLFCTKLYLWRADRWLNHARWWNKLTDKHLEKMHTAYSNHYGI